MIQPPRTILEATRLRRGLTQADLAAALGVGQSKVSLLESGSKRANATLVTDIASALNMPEDLLRRPSPAPRIGHLLRSSLRRTARNATLAELTMAHAHLDLLLDPRSSDLHSVTDSTDAEDLARHLRDRWKVQPGPISRLIPLLEEHGITCIFRDLSDLGSGALSSTAASGRTLLLVDASAPRVDVAWSLAHELGHLIFTGDPSKESEARADAFAMAFMLPEQDLRADDALGSSIDLAAAAGRYGVQPRLLAQRLRDVKIITHVQFRGLVHDSTQLPEASTPVLGSPSAIADAVRAAGGSRLAASQALLTMEELRQNYLAGSGTAPLH